MSFRRKTDTEYLWESVIPESEIITSSHRRFRYRLGKPIEPDGLWSATFDASPIYRDKRFKPLPEHVVIKLQILRERKMLYTPNAHMIRSRHEREFEMLRAAQAIHPAIVRLFDWGILTDQQDPSISFRFLVMETLSGGTLERNLLQQQQWHLHDKLYALYQLCGAVEQLHQARLLHGNLSLTNIVLRKPTEIGTMSIIDFSLARRIKRGRHEIMKERVGTPNRRPPEYIHPEQFPISLKTDVFSLGQIFTALLWSVKESDHIGMMLEVGKLKESGPPRPPTKEYDPVHHLILQMLSIAPQERPSAADVRYQLRQDYPEVFGEWRWGIMIRKSKKTLVTLARQTSARVHALLVRQDK